MLHVAPGIRSVDGPKHSLWRPPARSPPVPGGASSQLGPVGPRGRVALITAARARLAPGQGTIVDLGEFDLQELRALVGRSRFIGGDTGPLHIAAATETPIGYLRPTLAARSGWRAGSFVTFPWNQRTSPAGRAISGSARRGISAA